ncbi:MAG: energy transducer TonB [Acidobacteria bacterium]|nr:energy transducer TonB [Acidobacteriota bacterium]
MELTLIDDQPRSKSTLGYSLVLHVLGVLFAVMLPLFMTDVIKAPEHHYSVISLVTPRRMPKMSAPKVKLPPPKLVVNRQELPKLLMPKLARPTPAPPPTVGHFDAPKVLASAPQNALPRLVPSVHTGVLTGSSAPATVKAPVRKVQTGGFGDPNGLAPSANSKADGKLMMARLGSFDLPPGPGYGNGSGGAHGIRGTVASTGFGSSIAGPGTGGGQAGSPHGGGIHASGFEQAQVQEAPKPRALPSASPTKSAEITYKPNPVYTDEARALKLEGDVLLDVIFSANGQLHIVRVTRGLGHGLDEAAIRFAQQIRFKPAMRDGQPVDSEATLHVRFQLAY